MLNRKNIFNIKRKSYRLAKERWGLQKGSDVSQPKKVIFFRIGKETQITSNDDKLYSLDMKNVMSIKRDCARRG